MIRTILRDLWISRELFLQLVRRDLKLRYRQAIMGFAWALFLPVLTISAGLILRMAFEHNGGSGAAPSLGGIAIKSWAWAFFAGAMNFATVSLLANASLVTKIYFPREVLPLSAIVAQGVDSGFGLAILLLVGYWLGFHWSLQVLWLPVLILALLLLTTGLAFLFACANLFFRDVKYILQVLLTFGIFFTPVLFEPAMFSTRVGHLLMLNPLTPILEGLRLTLVERTSLLHALYTPAGALVWSPWELAYALLSGAACVLVGMVAFRRSAAHFAEYY
ncbi:MAG TPA: ABC transporter permease [Gemmatimonadales bacterium]|jgi:ABC-type polysaccharide/polyol phosphate export permease